MIRPPYHADAPLFALPQLRVFRKYICIGATLMHMHAPIPNSSLIARVPFPGSYSYTS